MIKTRTQIASELKDANARRQASKERLIAAETQNFYAPSAKNELLVIHYRDELLEFDQLCWKLETQASELDICVPQRTTKSRFFNRIKRVVRLILCFELLTEKGLYRA